VSQRTFEQENQELKHKIGRIENLQEAETITQSGRNEPMLMTGNINFLNSTVSPTKP